MLTRSSPDNLLSSSLLAFLPLTSLDGRSVGLIGSPERKSAHIHIPSWPISPFGRDLIRNARSNGNRPVFIVGKKTLAFGITVQGR